MTGVKLLSILVITLLLANVALLYIVMTKHPPEHHPGGPRNLIIEKLHLTENQIQTYDTLIKQHQGESKAIRDSIADLKSKLYEGLATGMSDSQSDSCIALISQLQVRMEHVHYRHFKDIQSLCTADQEKYFKDLTAELSFLFEPRGHNNPK